MFPKQFIAAGIAAGIKKSGKKDLAVFFSAIPAKAAGLFTANRAKAAPVLVSQKKLAAKKRSFRLIVANSGNANACTGAQGLLDAQATCTYAAGYFNVRPNEVLVASTGVIGKFLAVDKIKAGLKLLSKSSRAHNGVSAAEAIMTTDTFMKIASTKLRIAGKEVTMWACTKGSGMIHPVLVPHATMLGFILTDAAIEEKTLNAALRRTADVSFNCVTVDGDTSTNDSLFILANGAAGNKPIKMGSKAYDKFVEKLNEICIELARMIARDGEGATKLVEIRVSGANSAENAKKIAATIATSPLVKTAIFGNDANWGRILAAAGRSGVAINPDKVDISLGKLILFKQGRPVAFSESTAKTILKQKTVSITVNIHMGARSATYYTCDYSFDYIKINASYRS